MKGENTNNDRNNGSTNLEEVGHISVKDQLKIIGLTCGGVHNYINLLLAATGDLEACKDFAAGNPFSKAMLQAQTNPQDFFAQVLKPMEGLAPKDDDLMHQLFPGLATQKKSGIGDEQKKPEIDKNIESSTQVIGAEVSPESPQIETDIQAAGAGAEYYPCPFCGQI